MLHLYPGAESVARDYRSCHDVTHPCANSKSLQCVHVNDVCDHVVDCASGMDEANCSELHGTLSTCHIITALHGSLVVQLACGFHLWVLKKLQLAWARLSDDMLIRCRRNKTRKLYLLELFLQVELVASVVVTSVS